VGGFSNSLTFIFSLFHLTSIVKHNTLEHMESAYLVIYCDSEGDTYVAWFYDEDKAKEFKPYSGKVLQIVHTYDHKRY